MNPGALVLTSQRLVFIGSLLLEHTNLSIPLATVTSIDNQGMVVGFTTISMAGAQHRFLSLPAPFVTYVEQVRAWVLGASVQRTQPVESQVATQIRELATMHQSGLLTDDEFSAAKARLLT